MQAPLSLEQANFIAQQAADIAVRHYMQTLANLMQPTQLAPMGSWVVPPNTAPPDRQPCATCGQFHDPIEESHPMTPPASLTAISPAPPPAPWTYAASTASR